MNKPSSTITAATLAGMGMTLFWELVTQFSTAEITESLVAASVVFVSAAVGYFKKENVLK
jgi:hypothetical protein